MKGDFYEQKASMPRKAAFDRGLPQKDGRLLARNELPRCSPAVPSGQPPAQRAFDQGSDQKEDRRALGYRSRTELRLCAS